MALPGTGKMPEQFNTADEAYCRQIALQQSGGSSANQNGIDSEVRSATLGTLLGAAAGALIGGHEGAGVGAGTGRFQTRHGSLSRIAWLYRQVSHFS